MRIRILKPNLTILGKVAEVGAIVNDTDPNECRNLVADGRAEYLSPEEDATEEAKEVVTVEVESPKTETQPPAE